MNDMKTYKTLLEIILLMMLNPVFAQIETKQVGENIILMTQEDYFQFGIKSKAKKNLPFLSKIKKIDNTGQTLNLYGYIPNDYSEYSSEFRSAYYKMKQNQYYLVKLTRNVGKIYKLGGWSFFIKKYEKWKFPLLKTGEALLKSTSIMTVPYKIRGGNQNLDRITTSGISNVAINFDFLRYGWQRYYQNGKQYKWRISIGGMVSPGVEEISNSDLRNAQSGIEGTVDELFISTGITINLSLNDIGFTFIPAGWDQGTTTVGKSWNYNGRRWWGFGIGLSPKFLGPPTSQKN